MKIISSGEFDSYWKSAALQKNDRDVDALVTEIIDAVRAQGDEAVRRYAARFEKFPVTQFEIPLPELTHAEAELRLHEPELAGAIELASEHIYKFSLKQKAQFTDFEYEMDKGLVTGQRIIPVDKAAVYIPAGRFPLFSSVLMGLIPAFCAGVEQLVLASPPRENGLPDRRILAAAGISAQICGVLNTGRGGAGNLPAAASASGPGSAPQVPQLRIFALGGAQAIAGLALGTDTIPRVSLIAGPGNKYVAAAKRILFGEVGIDFIAGPTDVLIIAGDTAADRDCEDAAGLIAADMIAQAEHDPDACSRCLVPSPELAQCIVAALDKQLEVLPESKTARASLDSGGVIIVYRHREEAFRIANIIAPEHLQLHGADTEAWIPHLKNYGSLFMGSLSAEVLGDYSAGINHTLPTSGSARFTGGLSVRNFLKTVTTLRCFPGKGYESALNAAEILAGAEGLSGHAQSAALRRLQGRTPPVV